jgi:tetratricopeptide (TPR) repeat protein
LNRTGDQPEAAAMTRNLSHLYAFYLNEPDKATDLLNKALDMKSFSTEERARCKLELADILLLNNDPWEATLLYQQVYKDFKNDLIGQEAKFRNTKLSFYIGEFAWAKAQADILKAATSKLIANDAIALSVLIGENLDPDSTTFGLQMYARADLDDFRNDDDLALRTLDSVPGKFPGHPILDDVLLKKAEILVKTGAYTKADTTYGQLIADFPESVLADEALFGRARLRDNYLNDKSGAMGFYEELMTKYPGSVFVPEARLRFRILRGDKIQK